jgi:hypothetical protein
MDTADVAYLSEAGIDDPLNRCFTAYERYRRQTGRLVDEAYEIRSSLPVYMYRRLMLGIGRMTPMEWEAVIISK